MPILLLVAALVLSGLGYFKVDGRPISDTQRNDLVEAAQHVLDLIKELGQRCAQHEGSVRRVSPVFDQLNKTRSLNQSRALSEHVGAH